MPSKDVWKICGFKFCTWFICSVLGVFRVRSGTICRWTSHITLDSYIASSSGSFFKKIMSFLNVLTVYKSG